MTHVSYECSGINAEFELVDGKPAISFSDPSYVRATTVFLNVETLTVHVALHEGIFLVGKASAEFCESLKSVQDIELSSVLPSGDKVSLRSPVGILMSANGVECLKGDMHELVEDNLPIFSTGAHAMTTVIR